MIEFPDKNFPPLVSYLRGSYYKGGLLVKFGCIAMKVPFFPCNVLSWYFQPFPFQWTSVLYWALIIVKYLKFARVCCLGHFRAAVFYFKYLVKVEYRWWFRNEKCKFNHCENCDFEVNRGRVNVCFKHMIFNFRYTWYKQTYFTRLGFVQKPPVFLFGDLQEVIRKVNSNDWKQNKGKLLQFGFDPPYITPPPIFQISKW